MISPNKYCI